MTDPFEPLNERVRDAASRNRASQKPMTVWQALGALTWLLLLTAGLIAFVKWML